MDFQDRSYWSYLNVSDIPEGYGYELSILDIQNAICIYIANLPATVISYIVVSSFG